MRWWAPPEKRGGGLGLDSCSPLGAATGFPAPTTSSGPPRNTLLLHMGQLASAHPSRGVPSARAGNLWSHRASNARKEVGQADDAPARRRHAEPERARRVLLHPRAPLDAAAPQGRGPSRDHDDGRRFRGERNLEASVIASGFLLACRTRLPAGLTRACLVARRRSGFPAAGTMVEAGRGSSAPKVRARKLYIHVHREPRSVAAAGFTTSGPRRRWVARRAREFCELEVRRPDPRPRPGRGWGPRTTPTRRRAEDSERQARTERVPEKRRANQERERESVAPGHALLTLRPRTSFPAQRRESLGGENKFGLAPPVRPRRVASSP
ncbi:hypothetical protein JHW43_009628 [Diplocarpon mali]|nr:hypothetical protein JHW43_009628 [Diplocarpon mali]